MVLPDGALPRAERDSAATAPRSSRRSVTTLVVLTALAFACETDRDRAGVVAYARSVQPLLEAQCVRCHAGSAPAGGWAADSYLGAIGCVASGEPATLPPDGTAPLLRALERPDHQGLLSESERAVLASWIATGTSLGGGGVHAPSFADPRSPQSHGRVLRERRYAPMFDANDPDACGTCHDGAPTRRTDITVGAPNAPACTTCHVAPDGATACGTCHGEGERAHPPRSRCFFPGDAPDRVHAAHAGPSASRAEGLPCSTCHPQPADPRPAGTHANGYVDVWFDYAVAGRTATFDASTKTCAGTCHARGGPRPTPSWTDAPMGCNDCHASPPPDHYKGACTSCHREANADGTALVDPSLHVNGRVDLGDGSGRCGACHGDGDDPWPRTGAHQAHANPKSSRPVDCSVCHSVPLPGERHPEGRGGAIVRLTGLAIKGGRRASYDPTTKTCAGTYCHEGSGGTNRAPRWNDTSGTTCTSCHGIPPGPPHVESNDCASVCHAGVSDGTAIFPGARLSHVDGL